ncbi:unnamed protein product [Vitrella brassicaformis CCMP3155]|uniref:Amine oxidase domain-containing protein n=2 Tax=Vitrella brassicaformis TaxID=1169539 RepID=A0A0G4EU87_VITBC|nr:unnamed protein product [Vitrella brassicaformis CCMP3155]|eukprot:CEM02213.1 unnamed protein product [Vitrella brassicaformis CCMP3155]
MDLSCDVCVIGLGFAGIAAVRHLRSEGVNVIAIEAKGRVGGRACTMQLDTGEMLECGAQWLHGTEGNPLYDFAKTYDLLKPPNARNAAAAGPGRFFRAHGKAEFRNEEGEAEPHQRVELVNKVWQRLSDEASDAKRAAALPADLSLEDAAQTYNQEILQKDPASAGVIGWFSRLQEAIEGNPLADISAHHYATFEDLSGPNVRVWGGMQTLAQRIFDDIDIDQSNVLLGTGVTRIRYDADEGGGCVVEALRQCEPSPPYWCVPREGETTEQTDDGRDQDEEAGHRVVIKCRVVIVTVGLGVLKAAHSSLFDPPLPEWKRRAIEAGGIGVVDKLFVRCSPSSVDGHSPSHARRINWTRPLPRADGGSQGDDWTAGIYAFDPILPAVPSTSLLMTSWLVGPCASQLEKRAVRQPTDVMHEYCRAFSKATGDEWTPGDGAKSVSLLCTQWGEDECFRGSYSYLSVRWEGQGGCVCDVLGRAVGERGNKVLFAGEATNRRHYATVHGAYESGVREAAKAMDVLKSIVMRQ